MLPHVLYACFAAQLAEEQELEKQAAVQASERYRCAPCRVALTAVTVLACSYAFENLVCACEGSSGKRRHTVLQCAQKSGPI